MATQVAFSDLDSWLQAQPANTVDTPYELEITGLTTSDIGSASISGTLGNVIRNNNTKFVDLSETELPVVEDMRHAFYLCPSLVVAPVIPTGVTNIGQMFQDCTSLITAPAIPNSVTSAWYVFENCTSLVNAPQIPNSVTIASGFFYGCSSLVNAPILPDSITVMVQIFYNCISLNYKPLPSTSTTIGSTDYYNVTTPNWKGTLLQATTFNPSCTEDAEIKIYNDNRVTYEYSIYNINISTLSTYLAGLDPNTVATAYKIYIRGLTTSNVSNIKTALIANNTKYIDLSYTTIPQGTNIASLFCVMTYVIGCNSLIKSPVLPTDATSMDGTFAGCSNLKEIPTIPSGITNLQGAFAYTNIETTPIIPSGVTNLNLAFTGTKISSPPIIPNGVTDMFETFKFCDRLSIAPNIPTSVYNMNGTFNGCSNLTEVEKIPASVILASECFSGCTSLKKIDEFLISASTLDSSNFEDMFAGCTALESIGYKAPESTDWHLIYLNFDTNTVSGKVYARNGNETTIPTTSITKSMLTLPNKTDELMFSPNMSVAEIEELIEGDGTIDGMIDTHYSWYVKTVIPPDGNHLVLYAEDENKFVTNLNLGGGGGIEKVTVSASSSITASNDKRLLVVTSGVVVTLPFAGNSGGSLVDVFAIEDCSIVYYTAQGTSATLSMSAGTRAMFLYLNGWKYNGIYGAVWN